MSEDFNNPFAKLAKMAKARPESKAKENSEQSSQAPRKRKDKNKQNKDTFNSEDSRIFAEAMRNVSTKEIQKHDKHEHQKPASGKSIKELAGNVSNNFTGSGRNSANRNAESAKSSNLSDDFSSYDDIESFAALSALVKNDKAAKSSQTKQSNNSKLDSSNSSGGKQGVRQLQSHNVFMEEEQDEMEVEEFSIFSKAMSGVKPVTAGGRDINKPSNIKELAAQGIAPDPNAVLMDFLQGKLEFSLEFTEEYIQGHVLGLDPMVMGKLRAGQYSPEGNLDLHGLNAQQAYNSLIWFIKDAYQRGMRSVTVVTGRGRNSPDGIGILKEKIQLWLTKEPFKRVILAFCTAQPCDGGAGAIYIALRKYKKNHGKIHWDRIPSDEELL